MNDAKTTNQPTEETKSGRTFEGALSLLREALVGKSPEITTLLSQATFTNDQKLIAMLICDLASVQLNTETNSKILSRMMDFLNTVAGEPCRDDTCPVHGKYAKN